MKEKTSLEKNRAAKWILSAFVFVFLLMDSLGKVFQFEAVVKANEEMGFNTAQMITIGVILLVCSILYMIPKLAIIGSILLTGYLGGAVAIHIHANNPLFSHTLFPVYVGILAWLGLYIRNKSSLDGILKI